MRPAEMCFSIRVCDWTGRAPTVSVFRCDVTLYVCTSSILFIQGNEIKGYVL